MGTCYKNTIEHGQHGRFHGRDTNNAGGPQISQSTSRVRLKVEGLRVVRRRAPALPLILRLHSLPLIPTSTRHHTILYIHFFLISRR